MKILVTGGTGVVGAGVIPELLKRGHQARLLSRGANRDAREYAERVEPFAADIRKPDSLEGAAEGCEVVIHITGIIEEQLPDVTFERVNVGGTEHMLREAERAGARRFIFVSSLGADTGESEYHRSKKRAEDRVKLFPGEWLILRPGNVYGPGDDVISMLFKMVRSLPVVPVIGDGDQEFQPVWFQDLGKAILRAAEDGALHGETLELAGHERTTTRELLDLICEITDRKPGKLALPEWLAQAGTALTEMLGGSEMLAKSGLAMPVNSAKLKMLFEHNVIREPRDNALIERFRITPTPLRDGLARLADSLPELLPEEGVGALERKRFWADIREGKFSAPELLALFRENVTEIMPIDFASEPNVPKTAEKGNTLTGTIPGRGHFQVRTEEETPDSISFATIEGHPIAGMVTFRSVPHQGAVRFMVEIHARAANIFDWIALQTIGAPMQETNWKRVVARMIELSGGQAPAGVEELRETLGEEESARVEDWVREIVQRHHRQSSREDLAVA